MGSLASTDEGSRHSQQASAARDEAAEHASRPDRGSVIFLFLGELFLIPHLLPIAIALARSPRAPKITLLVMTSVHEEIVMEMTCGLTDVVIRRARGFRSLPAGSRETPRLPWKPLVLLRNGWEILHHDVAVVAERTSLWLPRVARRRGAAFIYNEHGAGPHANFASGRNRYAARILVPAEGMAERVRASGHPDAPIEIVGYVKHDFIQAIAAKRRLPAFAERRPTVVYVPHWLREKSSWWEMGEEVLAYFAQSTRYNLILAPHIRLPKLDPHFESRVARFRDCPNIHIDTRSFSLVDQSYIDNADIYVGDGSSQVVEYAERPRPAIFFNPRRIDWASDARFSHWSMGDVISHVSDLEAALAASGLVHKRYAPIQSAYVKRMMGTHLGDISGLAADVVLNAVSAQLLRKSGRTAH